MPVIIVHFTGKDRKGHLYLGVFHVSAVRPQHSIQTQKMAKHQEPHQVGFLFNFLFIMFSRCLCVQKDIQYIVNAWHATP